MTTQNMGDETFSKRVGKPFLQVGIGFKKGGSGHYVIRLCEDGSKIIIHLLSIQRNGWVVQNIDHDWPTLLEA